MQSKIRERFYDILIPTNSQDSISRKFNIGMLLLISLNVLAVILETEQDFYQQNKLLFVAFEIFSVAIFTIEYILRLWVCTKQGNFSSPILGRIRFALQPLQIIDLLAILPFYIPFIGLDLRFIRAVRLFRLFRLFKVGRYSQSLTTLTNAIRSKKEELSITLFAGFIVLIIASTLMYLVEHKAQPDTFHSIPDAMWWGVVTLTTVGYGDVYPKTVLGKFLGAGIAVLGIGLFALPAGIIASGFTSEIQKEKTEIKVCPHCGKNLTE
jgi:voltage-gated potassium channel